MDKPRVMAMCVITDVAKQTAKAIMVEVGEYQVWLPKSQASIYKHKDTGWLSVYIPIWLAKDKGLLGLNDRGQKLYMLYKEPNEYVDPNEFELINN